MTGKHRASDSFPSLGYLGSMRSRLVNLADRTEDRWEAALASRRRLAPVRVLSGVLSASFAAAAAVVAFLDGPAWISGAAAAVATLIAAVTTLLNPEQRARDATLEEVLWRELLDEVVRFPEGVPRGDEDRVLRGLEGRYNELDLRSAGFEPHWTPSGSTNR